jgi:branched-chain amino acid transport system ATP-binding protein
MSAPVLSLAGLCVRRGHVVAVADVGLEICRGQALALLGANGAGKSTLMQAIIGLLRPQAGRILFEGRAIDRLGPDRRARLGIGYCPEGRRVFPGLTVRENLAVACADSRAARAHRIEAAFDLFPALARQHATPGWKLSGGQQQMLAIGRSLMNAPRLLLLDEPTLGLAPAVAEQVLDRVPRLAASGISVIVAEQNVARALEVCDTAVVMMTGRIVRRETSAGFSTGDDLRQLLLDS